MKKIALLLALLLAMTLVMSGCQSKPAAAPTAAPTATPVVTEAPTEAPTAAPTEAPAAEPTEAPAEEAAAPVEIPAFVNGKPVSPDDVAMIAENLMYQYSQYGYDVTDPSFVATVNQYALEYAIQLELMLQKASEKGLDQFTDEELASMTAAAKAEWDELVAQYVAYYGGLTETSTEEDKAAATDSVVAMLASMGATEASWLADTMMNAILERIEEDMVQGVVVTDEDVQAAYDEKVKADEAAYATDAATYEYMTQYYGETSYYTPAGYRGITHILLEVDETLLNTWKDLTARLEEQEEAAEAAAAAAAEGEAAAEATEAPAEGAETAEATAEPVVPVTQADVDAAYQAILDSVKPTTDEIYAALEAGTPFADLIAKYNTDPGMQNEPYASEGYSVHQDSIMWDPSFTQASFSVSKVGEVAQPVVGSYGVHIVCYHRDVPAGAIELTDEVKNALRAELLATKEGEQFNTVLAGWMEEAEITYATAPAATEAAE